MSQPNINDTIKLLKTLSIQVEKLAQLKVKQAVPEINKYAEYIEKEARRRGSK